jgi:hypothetical protein
LALAAISVVSAVQAGTTVVEIELGDSFTGTIGQSGVDTVEAHFSALQGAAVSVTVQADTGSSLRPTGIVRDGGGEPIDGVSSLAIDWLPVGNLLLEFTIPVTGDYVLEIGGSSGSGGFWAGTSATGGSGPPDPGMTTLSGTVTDQATGVPIEGASVIVDSSLFAVTDVAGTYSGDLFPGSYSVTVDAEGYQSSTQAVELVEGASMVLDVALVAVDPVSVTIELEGDEVAGGVVTAIAVVEAPEGTMIESIVWTQEYGVAAAIDGADTDTATVTLGDLIDYKDELIHHLSEPPVGADELPPNVPLPEGEFPAGLQDRFLVVGINPFALEETGLIVLEVEVTTALGVASAEAEVHTGLPWKWTTGLKNVPTEIAVLLHGKDQESYDWALFPPAGSTAVLADGGTRNPYFTPDVPGVYEVEVTDLSEEGGLLTLQVHAGTWRGVIVDQDMDNRPVPDTACTFCHDGMFAADKFTPWLETGHAEIFTNNLDTSTHYGPNCFPCHTVGFDEEVENAGFDNTDDYQGFLDSGLINNPGDNWTTVLEQYPSTARLANIQCENCHGPQDSTGHGFGAQLGSPRIDLSSDVCAVCHGEPLRHARFQQWQLSGHANYELAIDEGDSGNCSRCHTANGFLEWLPILLDDDPETDPLDSIDVTWEIDDTHPQTCTACHDPHAEGTTSGGDSNATVRISGDTPPLIAGFQVTGAGRGAICMTCHNSRRGLRNDDTFDEFFGTSEAARAPHGSAQTDMLMGENAYLVEVGARGGHSFIDETCVDCHMESTPPPDVLSYNSGGTNHTFFAAKDICADCHSPHLVAEDIQNSVQLLMDQVQDLQEDGILALIGDLIDAGNTIDLDGEATIVDVADISDIEFGEARGRQSITVTFSGGATFGPYRMNDVNVVDATPEETGQLYDFAEPFLIKSGWNWNLVHNDGSLGIHNPFYFDARGKRAEAACRQGDVRLEVAEPRQDEDESPEVEPL